MNEALNWLIGQMLKHGHKFCLVRIRDNNKISVDVSESTVLNQGQDQLLSYYTRVSPAECRAFYKGGGQ